MKSTTKSILFLMPYPLGEAGSQRFRFEAYFSLLTESGFVFTTQSFWSKKTWPVLYKKGFLVKKILGFIGGLFRTIAILPTLKQYAFVFIHRETIPLGPPWIEWIIARIFRKKIIYDFDDAIWLRNTSEENKFVSKIKWHGKVKRICQWSYRVSCGNEFLASFARDYNQHVVVNPSTVDTTYHHPPDFTLQKKDSLITVGWTGSHSTLHYLQALEPVFKTIENKFSGQVQWLVIADKSPAWQMKSVVYLPWTKHSEISDLLRIDIGIMPLTDDIWAKGKCGFKILQYMSLEIPSIASAVGVNAKIIDHGVNGYLCNSPEEWIQCLESLIASKNLRMKMGKAAREKVTSSYSVLSNAPVFLSLFE